MQVQNYTWSLAIRPATLSFWGNNKETEQSDGTEISHVACYKIVVIKTIFQEKKIIYVYGPNLAKMMD